MVDNSKESISTDRATTLGNQLHHPLQPCCCGGVATARMALLPLPSADLMKRRSASLGKSRAISARLRRCKLLPAIRNRPSAAVSSVARPRSKASALRSSPGPNLLGPLRPALRASGEPIVHGTLPRAAVALSILLLTGANRSRSETSLLHKCQDPPYSGSPHSFNPVPGSFSILSCSTSFASPQSPYTHHLHEELE